MKHGFWKTVQHVIEKSDVVLHVVDARYPHESRNKDLEYLVNKAKKKILYVVTKSDLVPGRRKKPPFEPYVFVSSKSIQGIGVLKGKIKQLANVKGRKPNVGVVGYPNVGKSSLINILKGKGAASTSSEPGHTKGKQYVSSRTFFLIDTPGVIPKSEHDPIKHLTLAMKPTKQDPENAALQILEEFPDECSAHYDLEVTEDEYDMLEALALKVNFLKKGGEPDTMRAAKLLVKEWQEGSIQS